MANRQEPTSFDEVLSDLRKNSNFRKAQRRVAPYFDLALEVIKRRIELGLTQEDLAERAATFQSRISKIESGEHDIRFSTLIDIAEALECEVTKNILVPIADNEYQPEDDEFRWFWVSDSLFQKQRHTEYSAMEEYQPA